MTKEDTDAIGTGRSGVGSHVQPATSVCLDLLAMKASATEALQTAREDTLTISARMDEARTATLTVSTGSVYIAQLLTDARQARDLARSEAAEVSQFLQAAHTNLDNIMSEVLDTAREIAAEEAQRWVDKALSAEDGALNHAI